MKKIFDVITCFLSIGLDSAGPYFENTDSKVRLDPTDALFVDVIHTDGANNLLLGLGRLILISIKKTFDHFLQVLFNEWVMSIFIQMVVMINQIVLKLLVK